MSALANATVDGIRLTDEEVLGFCALLLVAGYETTTNLLGTPRSCWPSIGRPADAWPPIEHYWGRQLRSCCATTHRHRDFHEP